MELSYELSGNLIREIKDVELLAARRWESLRKLDSETLAFVRRQARISTIGATTRVENAVLTDVQIEWVDTELARDGKPTAFLRNKTAIQQKLKQDRARSLEEVAGCREMLAIVYDQSSSLFPLTQSTIRGLHHELLKYYPAANFHLGKYKLVSNSVVEHNNETGEERVVLKTSDPGPLTDTAMDELLSWYNTTLPSSPWTLAVASEFVFRFLACHPFQDGNGRIGRALFLLCLLQSSDEHFRKLAPYLSMDRAIEQRKQQYYIALAQTGREFSGDAAVYRLGIFLQFMLKVVRDAIESIDVYVSRQQTMTTLPEKTLMVLQSFKDTPETRLAPKEIQQRTNLPQRTVTRGLKLLVDSKLIQKYGRPPRSNYQLIF